MACPSSASGRFLRMSHYSRLCRARDYLAARFNERTSLAEASAQAGLSPFYFHRLFAEAFNETPHQFVTRLRSEEHTSELQSRRHLVCRLLLGENTDNVSRPATTRAHATPGGEHALSRDT